MNRAWRLWGEFRPAVETGDERQAIQWARDTLESLGVADAVVERLTQHLAEMALFAGKQPVRTALLASCQVFVPADGDADRHGPFDWAYFLVTRPGCATDPDNADGRPGIQVFLYPAAHG